MKINCSLLCAFLALVLVTTACSINTISATPTPLPTLTQMPTLTPLPSPTPMPTPTVVPTPMPTAKPTLEDILINKGFVSDTDVTSGCSSPCRGYWYDPLGIGARDYDDGTFVIWFALQATSNNPSIAKIEDVVNTAFGPDFGAWYETEIRGGFSNSGTTGVIDGRNVLIYINTAASGTNYTFYRLLPITVGGG